MRLRLDAFHYLINPILSIFTRFSKRKGTGAHSLLIFFNALNISLKEKRCKGCSVPGDTGDVSR